MQETKARGADYPVGRKSFFCVKYINYALDSAAAMEVGAIGVLLLIAVVQREDSRRYGSAPKFWNRHFTDRLAISEDSLARTRKKCIDAGWLHYERGGKSVAGLYWVTLPQHVLDAREDELDWYGPTKPAHSGSKQSNNSKSGFSPQIAGRSAETSQRQTKDKLGTSAEHSSLPLTQTLTQTSSSSSGDDDGILKSVELTESGRRQSLINRIKQAGVLKATNTFNLAKKLDQTDEQIAAVIEYFEAHPNAWDSYGVLRWRLNNEDAVTYPPNEGWPPMKSGVQAKSVTKKQSDANKARLESERIDSDKRRAKKEKRIQETEKLLDKFGGDIDSLSKTDRIALLKSDFHKQSLARAKDWRKSSVKLPLLKAFEESR